MLKCNELRSATSCLNKAASDEPVFVLRAKDRHAAQTVRLWAAMAEGIHEPEKISEALALATEMDKWRAAHQSPEPADATSLMSVAQPAKPRVY